MKRLVTLFGGSVTRRATAALAVALVLAGLVIWLISREADRQTEAAARVTADREVLAVLDGLVADLGEADASRCAYLSRGEPAQASLGQAAGTRIRQKLQQLHDLLAADAPRRDQLTQADILIERKLALMEQSLQLRQRVRFGERSQLALTREIHTLCEPLRLALASLRAEEDRDLIDQTRQTQASARQVGAVAAVGNCLTLLFLAVSALAVRQELVSRGQSQRAAQERAVEQTARLIATQKTLEELAALRSHLEEQLRQAQGLASVGRVTSGVAHDFNNLLTLILAGSEASLRSLPADDPSRPFLSEVVQAGRHAAVLTRQLLAAGRGGHGCPEQLDLNALVNDAAPLLRRLAGRGVELALDLSPEPKPIWADAGQLDQVLLNLVVNARDAVPGGGKLTLQTRQEGTAAVLTVTDTGCGMDQATLARVFEPFFTTKEPGKGTGLGMVIVRDAVQQCGGRIEIESEPGHGTQVRIFLPLAEAHLSEPRGKVERKEA